MPVYTLPNTPYDYGARRPAVSGGIPQPRYSRHRAGHVKGSNGPLDQFADACGKGDHVQELILHMAVAASPQDR
jgi:Fe-Mn family superoxide dismutase